MNESQSNLPKIQMTRHVGSLWTRIDRGRVGGGGAEDGRGARGAAAAAASLPGLNAAGITIIQMNAKKS